MVGLFVNHHLSMTFLFQIKFGNRKSGKHFDIKEYENCIGHEILPTTPGQLIDDVINLASPDYEIKDLRKDGERKMLRELKILNRFIHNININLYLLNMHTMCIMLMP